MLHIRLRNGAGILSRMNVQEGLITSESSLMVSAGLVDGDVGVGFERLDREACLDFGQRIDLEGAVR